MAERGSEGQDKGKEENRQISKRTVLHRAVPEELLPSCSPYQKCAKDRTGHKLVFFGDKAQGHGNHRQIEPFGAPLFQKSEHPIDPYHGEKDDIDIVADIATVEQKTWAHQ